MEAAWGERLFFLTRPVGSELIWPRILRIAKGSFQNRAALARTKSVLQVDRRAAIRFNSIAPIELHFALLANSSQ
jgi:hypothetical protein